MTTAQSDATARFLALVNANRPEPRPAPAFPAMPPTGGSAYAATALANELANVRTAYEGSRNDTLNTAVFNVAQLVASGHLDRDTVEAEFRQAAHDAGLPAGEALATIRSGLRGGTRHPRHVETAPEISATVIETTIEAILGEAPPPALTTATNAPQDDDKPDLSASSWFARPVLDRAAQQATAPEPVFLVRLDGVALLYPGKINGLVGESESGKTWVALHAVEQLLKQGRRVTVLDFEDAASTWVARLRLLGVTDEQLELLHYADPDEALGIVGQAALGQMLAEHNPDLIVLDGANAAMTLLGLDLNDNADATKFNRLVLKPLTQLGAAVLTIDHVPKNADARGKGAIGAQAKRAMIDGAQFIVEVTQPFGVGQRGELKLLVDKDRAGYVRGKAGGARFAGKAIIDSTATTSTSVWIEGPQSNEPGDTPWRPTHLMEQVSKLLEDVPEGLSTRQIRDEVKGRNEAINMAINALVEGRWAARTTRSERGGGLLVTLNQPYREGDQNPIQRSGSKWFQVVPGTSSDSGSEPVPPLRGPEPLRLDPETTNRETLREPLPDIESDDR